MANITLALDDMEQQALNWLLDTALRQAGLNALDVVSHFAGRILAAQNTSAQALAGNRNQVQAQTAAPVQPMAANGATTNPKPLATAQHQSVLSHLMAEIAGETQSQTAAHPPVLAGTASKVEPGFPGSGSEGGAHSTQSAATSPVAG